LSLASNAVKEAASELIAMRTCEAALYGIPFAPLSIIAINEPITGQKEYPAFAFDTAGTPCAT
jgi:hypothetical protein